MKRIFYSLIMLIGLALLSTQSATAQLKSSYFMEGSYFRTELNPALKPTRGYIAVPALSGYSGGIYGNVDLELIRDLKSNFDSMNASEFLGKLPRVSRHSMKGDLTLFGAGFYSRKKVYWTFGANLHHDTNLAVSRDVAEILAEKRTGVYDVKSLGMDNSGYFDAFVGSAFNIGKYLSLGVRAKFLIGIQNVDIRVNQLSAKMVDGDYEVTPIGEWRMNSIENNHESVDDASVWRNLRSFGGAIDLGAELSLLGDRLRVSAAVTDLGFIYWGRRTHLGGYIEDEFDGDDTIADLGYAGYATRLNCNLNVGVEYRFCKDYLSVGLLSHTRFYRYAISTELTASFNARPTDWLTFTLSHTMLNANRPGVFGAAINIHPRAINIFMGMDYIGARYKATGLHPFQFMAVDTQMMMPRSAKSFNLYIGIGFNLARPKWMRKAEKEM